MTPEQFAHYADIGLIAVFILVAVFFFLSAFIGYRKGVWSTTFRLMFIGLSIVGVIISLSAISDFVGKFPISDLLPFKSITITNSSSGEYYNVTITNISDTLYETLKGYYILFNMSSSPSAAHAFALGMALSILKLIAFFVSMLVIVVFGNILCTILWHVAFKYIVPKLARKKFKSKWVSFGQNMVIYVASCFMLLAPLTSLINVANSTYKRNSQGASDGYVAYVDKFLKSYDNSLFAKTFFNWNTNGNDFSIDSQFINAITRVTIDGTKTSIIDTVHDITEVASYLSNSFLIDNGHVAVDSSLILDRQLVTGIFDSLKNSYFFAYLLPIGVDFALTLEAVTANIDTSLINVNDYDWKNEVDNIENIYLELLDAGLVEDLTNQSFTFTEDTIRELLKDERAPSIQKALAKIDDSLLLKRALESVVYKLTQSNNMVAEYLPTTINELDDIEWGFELSVYFDSLYKLNKIDDRFLHAAFNYEPESFEPTLESESAVDALNQTYNTEVEEEPDLITLIAQHLEAIQDLLVGETDNENRIINVDSEGRTRVYTPSGKKVEGKSYNIFDLKISKYLLRPIGKFLSSVLPGGKVDKLNNIYNELLSGKWRLNLKQEYACIFDTLKPFSTHTDLLSDLLQGHFPSSLDEFSDELIGCVGNMLPRVDKSKILSCAFYDTIIETAENSRTTFVDFGLHYDLIEEGLNEAVENHVLGKNFAPIVLAISDINTISNVLSDSDLSSDDIINALGSDDINMSLARILDAMYSSSIVNYSHDESDKDTNYFHLMEYVFTQMNTEGVNFFDSDYTLFRSSTAGLKFTNTVNPDGTLTYDGENGYFCNVIKALKATNIISTINNDPNFFDNNNNYLLLAKSIDDGGLDLPYLLKNVNDSKIFAYIMSTFLDNKLSVLVDLDRQVTFFNVKDWENEGLILKDILVAVGTAPDIKLNSLDFQAINDIVGLNNVLHYLVRSNIFVDKNDLDPATNHRFGDWFYRKVQSNLSSFELNGETYNLLSDPDGDWDTDWGLQDGPDAGYNILYHDCIYSDNGVRRTYYNWVGQEELWYDLPTFDVGPYIDDTYEHYYNNPSFYPDYQEYLSSDELGQIINTIYWTGKVENAPSLNDISSETLSGLLNAINETRSLRILIYNFFDIAKGTFDDMNESLIDLSPAQTKYLINCGQGMWDFEDYYDNFHNLIEGDRSLRRKEINCLTELYDLFKVIEDDICLDDGIDLTKINGEFSRRCSNALVKLNQSSVFHRQGPANGTTTVFQNSVSSFLTSLDGIKDIIYSSNSPKDIYNVQQSNLYTDAVSKANYLVKDIFPYNDDVSGYQTQENEIKQVFEVVSSVIGGYIGDSDTDHYGKLVDENGNYTLDFGKIDWKEQSNIYTINVTLGEMNKSALLFDAVPNMIERALAINSDALISGLPSGTKTYLNLASANIYHNYFIKTTSDDYTLDFNRRMTDDDLEVLGYFLQEVSLFLKGDPSCKIPTDFNDLTYYGDETHADNLEDLLSVLAGSDIFHSAGTSLTIDNEGHVIEKVTGGQTVFQEVIMQFLVTTDIKEIIYNENSPKDQYNGYVSHPLDEAVEAKSIDLIEQYFPARNGLDSVVSREINNIRRFFEAASKHASINFDDLMLEQLNIDDAIDMLSTLNDSDLLYDCVPNILYKLFNTAASFDTLSGVNFANASPFFVYQYGGDDGATYIPTPSYNRHYPEAELTNLRNLIKNYIDLSGKIGDGDFNNLNVIGQILDGGDLLRTLKSIYESYSMHKCNEYRNDSQKTTVFEDCISYLLSESGLSEFMFNDNSHGYATKDEYIITKIKYMSSLDYDENAINTNGYHEKWFDTNDKEGEVNALLDFVNTGRILLSSGSSDNSYNFANAQLERISPDDVLLIMRKMNHTDLASDALPAFIKEGFQDASVGIGALATYNNVEKTSYYLTQYEYGGPKSGGNDRYEIDLIYNALQNMAKYDSENRFIAYEQFNNLQDFVNNEYVTGIEGIMQYVTKSKILNNETWQLSDGHEVKTRGLIFFNLLNLIEFDSSNNRSLDEFVIGNTQDERIYALSEIFNINDFNSSYEAQGLYKMMVTNGDAISDISGCLDNVSDLRNYESAVSNLMECAYNADNHNHRSYLVSQIVSSMMNQVISQEEEKTASSDIHYVPVRYGPVDINHIDASAYTTTRNSGGRIYASLNEVEKDGILGVLRLEKLIERVITFSTDRVTQDEMNEAFSLMGSSYIAKVVYAYEIDNYLTSPYAHEGIIDVRNEYCPHIFNSDYDFTDYGITLSNILKTNELID